MKFFTKRKNIQKIIILFLILIGINFVVPTYSKAGTGADIGGILLSPVVSLFAAVFDGLNGMMQYMMLRREWLWDISNYI